MNKSARERIGRQNLSQKVPSKKGSLGVMFSPRNYRENAHSKSANFEGRHSGGHLLGRPLLFTSETTEGQGRMDTASALGSFLGFGFGFAASDFAAGLACLILRRRARKCRTIRTHTYYYCLRDNCPINSSSLFLL